MAAELFKTTLSLGQDANTSPAEVDPFRTMLDSIGDPAEPAGRIQLAAMIQDANALTEVKSGALNFAYGSATAGLGGSLADHLTFTHEFGMEVAEFMSWWYEGGGQALFQGLLNAEGIYQFPICLRASESGGWFREAITLDKMIAGEYSNGDQLKYRAFGTHAKCIDDVFAGAVSTPPTTAGSTELADIFAGIFNCGEFNEPIGDASIVGGLFPNGPADKTGSIIEALGGRPHYYVGSYHTSFRARVLWVNKAYFDALSANDQDRIEAASRHCMTRNVANSMQGGDAIIKQWQDQGTVVHAELPHDLLDRLRRGLEEAQDAIAATDANYATVLAHQRAFMQANGVRWGSMPRRRYRNARTAYETTLKAL